MDRPTITYASSDLPLLNIASPPRLLSRGATRASATAGLTSFPSLWGSWPGDLLGVLAIFVGGAPGEQAAWNSSDGDRHLKLYGHPKDAVHHHGRVCAFGDGHSHGGLRRELAPLSALLRQL
jgi:hypothetical protein